MLLAKFVFLGVRSRIAPQPEILDERLPLVVGLQGLKNIALLVRNNVADLFVQPPLIRCFQLSLELLLIVLFLSIGLRLGDRLASRTRALTGLRRRRRILSRENRPKCYEDNSLPHS